MLETLVGVLGTATLGVVGWAFHLGNRTTALEASKASIEDSIETKFEAIKTILDSNKETITAMMDGVDKRLDRIEKKLWNGHA